MEYNLSDIIKQVFKKMFCKYIIVIFTLTLLLFPDLTPDTLVVGLSRVGALDQKIVAGSLEYMQKCDLGPPLHSLVIPAPNLHPLELEYLAQFR